MWLILIILLILIVVGLPNVSGHVHNMGYGPTGILGVVLVIVLVLFLMGRL